MVFGRFWEKIISRGGDYLLLGFGLRGTYIRRTCLGMEFDYSREGRCAVYFRKIFEMVNDPSTDSIVSWSDNGKSFIVWNESEFCRDVLPRFLVFRKMRAFIRRLEMLGFKKIESEQWEYANDYFVRGHPELEPPRESFAYQRPPEEVAGRAMERAMERMMEMASAIRKRQAERVRI